jgi:hypothetical protein
MISWPQILLSFIIHSDQIIHKDARKKLTKFQRISSNIKAQKFRGPRVPSSRGSRDYPMPYIDAISCCPSFQDLCISPRPSSPRLHLLLLKKIFPLFHALGSLIYPRRNFSGESEFSIRILYATKRSPRSPSRVSYKKQILITHC